MVSLWIALLLGHGKSGSGQLGLRGVQGRKATVSGLNLRSLGQR